MHRTVSILAMALLSTSAAIAQTPSEDPIPFDPKVTVGQLDNGLRYYVRENPEPRDRVELRLVLNAGSIQEDDDQLGLAHFVEHMAFNGTEHFEKQALIDYLQSIGMQFGPDINAYTSFDETVYMLTIPTDQEGFLEQGFAILEDWAHGISFEAEEIDKERGVVIEEWRLRQGAGDRIRHQTVPVLYHGSRYAERRPIGEKAILESFDHDTLRRFYRDWYRPDLMAVVVVGDIETGRVETLIREHFTHLANPPSPRPREEYPVPGHDETLFARVTDEEATQTAVSVHAKLPRQAVRTLGDYRQNIVEFLYHGMFNARLFELTQQAEPPFLFGSLARSDMGRLADSYVMRATVEDGGVVAGLTALLVEAERARRHGFTEQELDVEKRNLLRGVERMHAERDKTRSPAYVDRYVEHFLTGRPSPGIENALELYQQMLPGITLDEINQLGRDWTDPRNRVVLATAPQKEAVPLPTEEELLQAFAAVSAMAIAPYEKTISEEPLVGEAPAASAIEEETRIDELDLTQWKLANGVRVLLKPTDFQDDEILVRGYSPGGTSLVPDEDYTSASFAAGVVARGGLGSFSLVDLQKKLAGKAVSMSPSINSLYEGVSASASLQDIETMFELIYLTFTQPRRDEDAFASLKSRYQSYLANRDADPQQAFSDTLNVLLTQRHYRARPLTAQILDELDLDTIMDVYRDRFADASDFTFVFVGNLDPAQLRPLVETWLGGLPNLQREETWRDVGMDAPTGVHVRDVYKGIEPKGQTQIVFTGPFEWTRENRVALSLMTRILRERAREVLREDLGGTYGVNIGGAPQQYPKPEFSVSIAFGCDPQRLRELSDTMFDLVRALQAEGPTPDELIEVREILRRSYEEGLRENDFWMGQLVYVDQNGIDPRLLLDYENMLQEIDAQDVQRAAQAYLPLDNYVQVSLFPESFASEDSR